MNDEIGKELAIKLVDAIEDLIVEKVAFRHSDGYRVGESLVLKRRIVKILTDPVE